jgi:hypothetical protein
LLVPRAQLHHCNVAGRTVFLDAATGRYFCLPPRREPAFAALLSGGADKADIDWFQNRGFLTERSTKLVGGADDTPLVKAPVEAIVPAEHAGSGLIFRVVLTRALVLAKLRTQAFPAIYAELRRDDCRPDRVAEQDIYPAAAKIAAAFRDTDVFFGRTDQCLPRSIAFFHMCRRAGLRPSLVIGVRINPFTAHCWVQADALVLNDTVDQVRVFTPILAI